ncbi:hypothetical protein HK100_008886, partial [Physocladia obscura]
MNFSKTRKFFEHRVARWHAEVNGEIPISSSSAWTAPRRGEGEDNDGRRGTRGRATMTQRRRRGSIGRQSEAYTTDAKYNSETRNYTDTNTKELYYVRNQHKMGATVADALHLELDSGDGVVRVVKGLDGLATTFAAAIFGSGNVAQLAATAPATLAANAVQALAVSPPCASQTGRSTASAAAAASTAASFRLGAPVAVVDPLNPRENF